MYALHRELAVKEQRFEDARNFQSCIYHEMTHSQPLRLVGGEGTCWCCMP